jgi:chromate transporter
LELAAVFGRIGTIGIGGPAVTIAMMEEEVVARRGWLSREHFLDIMGAANLIPGPNATEIAIHVGQLRAGWRGMLVAGASFIVPAGGITTALAWAYVRYGRLPQVTPFLVGVKPAVLAIILAALWRLGQTAVKGRLLAAIGAVALLANLLGMNEILAMFGGGMLGMVALRLAQGWRPRVGPGGPGSLGLVATGAALARLLGGGGGALAGAAAVAPLWQLALFFLKVGAVLYGSGYVLIAFLEQGLVRDLGWLTQEQLLDAVAAGQITPGPLFSTAGFIGYLLHGGVGAAVSIAAIFAPSFLFVALLTPLLPRLRRSPWSAAFLDAINVSALALMAAVALRLGAAMLLLPWAIPIATVAFGLALRKVNPAWLVLGGAVLGWVATQARW